MPEFHVDDEVVEAVWRRANPKPFENLTFNTALRRVLELPNGAARNAMPQPGHAESTQGPGKNDELDQLLDEALTARPRLKAPKADLRELVQAGLLRNGEELYLIDYQGARVQQYKATVSGGLLQFKGQSYSMSDLARDLLKKVGFRSDAVRGPAHWANARGVSVRDLWQQLLDKRAKK